MLYSKKKKNSLYVLQVQFIHSHQREKQTAHCLLKILKTVRKKKERKKKPCMIISKFRYKVFFKRKKKIIKPF